MSNDRVCDLFELAERLRHAGFIVKVLEHLEIAGSYGLDDDGTTLEAVTQVPWLGYTE